MTMLKDLRYVSGCDPLVALYGVWTTYTKTSHAMLLLSEAAIEKACSGSSASPFREAKQCSSFGQELPPDLISPGDMAQRGVV